ncbi:MAG: hypothetical protein ACRBEQ_02505 [Hyphomonas sp.]
MSVTPARILTKQKALKPKGFLKRSIPVTRFTKIEAQRIQALANEAGLIFHRPDGEPLYVGEYDPGFMWLARKLDLDDRLGEGWLTRAEAGEHLSTPLAA